MDVDKDRKLQKGAMDLVKVMIGCSLFLASIGILCSGFIISAIGSSDRTVNTNFTYSILDIHWLWTVVPIVLFIVACLFTYSGYKEYSYNQVEKEHKL